MAKDAFDIVTDVISLVNVPSIISLLQGGKIDASVKTTPSSVRGIVVNSIGITNTQDQIGYGNANCYAPSIIPTINGKSVQLPDHPALSTLAKAVVPLIDEQYKPTFRCWVEDLPTITQDTDGSYFANIGFRYQSIKDN